MQVSEGHLILQRLAAIIAIILACWHGTAYYLQSFAIAEVEIDVSRSQATFQDAKTGLMHVRQQAQILDDDQIRLAVDHRLNLDALRLEALAQRRLDLALQSKLGFSDDEADDSAALIIDSLIRRDLGHRIFADAADQRQRLLLDGRETIALHRALSIRLGRDSSHIVQTWLATPSEMP